MTNGWVPLHRSPFRDFAEQFTPKFRSRAAYFWVEACMLANWEPTHLDGKPLARGQFVFGRDKMAQKLGISVGQLRTIVKYLEKMGELTIETTSKGTIATIVQYETYAGFDHKNDQQDDQQTTNERPANDHSEQTNNHISKQYRGDF